MKTFTKLRSNLYEESCPIATHDLNVNVNNRQHAIDEYHYGPANPAMPENYWKDAAADWKIEENTAKNMTCSNCAAFNVSPKMKNCINAGIGDSKEDGAAIIELANLGYCELLHFKCAGSRSCGIWLTNGPLE